jgi:hypothetical protein
MDLLQRCKIETHQRVRKMEQTIIRLDEREQQLQQRIDRNQDTDDDSGDQDSTGGDEAKAALLELQDIAASDDTESQVVVLQQQLIAAEQEIERSSERERQLQEELEIELELTEQTAQKLKERDGMSERSAERMGALRQQLFQMTKDCESVKVAFEERIAELLRKLGVQTELAQLVSLEQELAHANAAAMAEKQHVEVSAEELEAHRQQWTETKSSLERQIAEVQAVEAKTRVQASAMQEQLDAERGKCEHTTRALEQDLQEARIRVARWPEEGAKLEGEARALHQRAEQEHQRGVAERSDLEAKIRSEEAEGAIQRARLQEEVATTSAALLQLRQESTAESERLNAQLSASRARIQEERETLGAEAGTLRSELATKTREWHNSVRELELKLEVAEEEALTQKRRLVQELEIATEGLGSVRVSWGSAKMELEKELREAIRLGERAHTKMDAELDAVTMQLKTEKARCAREKRQLTKELVEVSEQATVQQQSMQAKLHDATKELAWVQQRWTDERASLEQEHAEVCAKLGRARALLEGEYRVVKQQLVDEEMQHAKETRALQEAIGAASKSTPMISNGHTTPMISNGHMISASSNTGSGSNGHMISNGHVSTRSIICSSAGVRGDDMLTSTIAELEIQRARHAEETEMMVIRLDAARANAEEERIRFEEQVGGLRAAGERQQQQIAAERLDLQVAAEEEIDWNQARCDELRTEIKGLERRMHTEKQVEWREEKQQMRQERRVSVEAMEVQIGELRKERAQQQSEFEQWVEQRQQQQAVDAELVSKRENELHTLTVEVRRVRNHWAAEKRRSEEECMNAAAAAAEGQREQEHLQQQLASVQAGRTKEGERLKGTQEGCHGGIRVALDERMGTRMGTLDALQREVRESAVGLRVDCEHWAKERACLAQQQQKVRHRLMETVNQLHDERRRAMLVRQDQQTEHARERRRLQQQFVTVVQLAEREEAELAAAIRALELDLAQEGGNWEEEKTALLTQEEAEKIARKEEVQEAKKVHTGLKERVASLKQRCKDEGRLLRERVDKMHQRREIARDKAKVQVHKVKEQLADAERQVKEQLRVLEAAAAAEKKEGEREEGLLRLESEQVAAELEERRRDLFELRAKVQVLEGARGLTEEQLQLKKEIEKVRQERQELDLEWARVKGGMKLQKLNKTNSTFAITLELEMELTEVKRATEEAQRGRAVSRVELEEELVRTQRMEEIRQQELQAHVRNLREAGPMSEAKWEEERQELMRQIDRAKQGKSKAQKVLKQQLETLRIESEEAATRAQVVKIELTQRLHRTEERRRQSATEGVTLLSHEKAKARATAEAQGAKEAELEKRLVDTARQTQEEEQEIKRIFGAFERVEEGKRRDAEEREQILQRRLVAAVRQLSESKQRCHQEEQEVRRRVVMMSQQVEEHEEELKHEVERLTMQMEEEEAQWREEKHERENELQEATVAVGRKKSKVAELMEAVEVEQEQRGQERALLAGRVEATEDNIRRNQAEAEAALQVALEAEDIRQMEWVESRQKLEQQLKECERRGRQMVVQAGQRREAAGRTLEAAADARVIEEQRLQGELKRWEDVLKESVDWEGAEVGSATVAADDGRGLELVAVTGAHTVRAAVHELAITVGKLEAEAEASRLLWETRKTRMETQLAHLEQTAEGAKRTLELRREQLGEQLKANRLRWEGDLENDGEGEGILTALRQRLDDAERAITRNRALLAAEVEQTTEQLASYDARAKEEKASLEWALARAMDASSAEEATLREIVAQEKQELKAQQATWAEEAAAVEVEAAAAMQETEKAKVSLTAELSALQKRLAEREVERAAEMRANESEHQKQVRQGEEAEQSLREERDALRAKLEALKADYALFEAELHARSGALDSALTTQQQEMEKTVVGLRAEVDDRLSTAEELKEQLLKVAQWETRLEKEGMPLHASTSAYTAAWHADTGSNSLRTTAAFEFFAKCEVLLVEGSTWCAEQQTLEQQLQSLVREEGQQQERFCRALRAVHERSTIERRRHECERADLTQQVRVHVAESTRKTLDFDTKLRLAEQQLMAETAAWQRQKIELEWRYVSRPRGDRADVQQQVGKSPTTNHDCLDGGANDGDRLHGDRLHGGANDGDRLHGDRSRSSAFDASFDTMDNMDGLSVDISSLDISDIDHTGTNDIDHTGAPLRPTESRWLPSPASKPTPTGEPGDGGGSGSGSGSGGIGIGGGGSGGGGGIGSGGGGGGGGAGSISSSSSSRSSVCRLSISPSSYSTRSSRTSWRESTAKSSMCSQVSGLSVKGKIASGLGGVSDLEQRADKIIRRYKK